jgi:hypothetical protein
MAQEAGSGTGASGSARKWPLTDRTVTPSGTKSDTWAVLPKLALAIALVPARADSAIHEPTASIRPGSMSRVRLTRASVLAARPLRSSTCRVAEVPPSTGSRRTAWAGRPAASVFQRKRASRRSPPRFRPAFTSPATGPSPSKAPCTASCSVTVMVRVLSKKRLSPKVASALAWMTPRPVVLDSALARSVPRRSSASAVARKLPSPGPVLSNPAPDSATAARGSAVMSSWLNRPLWKVFDDADAVVMAWAPPVSPSSRPAASAADPDAWRPRWRRPQCQANRPPSPASISSQPAGSGTGRLGASVRNTPLRELNGVPAGRPSHSCAVWPKLARAVLF